MVVFVHIESAISCHLNKHRLNRIYTDVSLYQTGGERRKQGKKMQMSANGMRCLFLQVPDISLLFPVALRYGKHFLLLQAETCDKTQNKKRNYKKK